jgi:hypothetical protein
MSNFIECVICYEPVNDNNTITFENCNHGNRIHTECMSKWNNYCPICRALIHNTPSKVIDENTITVTKIYSSRLYRFTLSNQ